MERAQIIEIGVGVMEESESVYLTTLAEGNIPITRAMLNLRNPQQYPSLVNFFSERPEELVVFFTTNTSSDKITHIMRKPCVSAYYCQPKVFHGIMLGGIIQVENDVNIIKRLWQDGWEKYYPHGYDDPDHTVLKLVPDTARGWFRGVKFAISLNQLATRPGN